MTKIVRQQSDHESVRQLLRILHTSLPADASFLFSCPAPDGKPFLLDAYGRPDGKPAQHAGCLERCALLEHAATHHRALCAGHYPLRVKDGKGGRESSLPVSLLLIPTERRESTAGGERYILCFIRTREDAYRHEDLHFLRNMIRRYRLFLEHVAPSASRFSPEAAGEPEAPSIETPHILTNLLASFLSASRRVLPVDALVLTLWSDVIKQGEFMQVLGCSEEELSRSAWIDRREVLERNLGSPLRVKNFVFFYKKCKVRLELEEFIPRLASSVSARLTRGDETVGTISLKSTDEGVGDLMAGALPDLVPLMLWELRVAGTRHAWKRRAEGSELSIVNTRAFQDDLIRNFRFASRYGEPLSALIFTPPSPFRYSDAGEESFARLFTLMRKSIRAVDSACYFGANGFSMLLPKATYRDSLKVADRLMNLADQVLKHDRYLGNRLDLSYRVVSYPESAGSDVDLWEAIVDTVPA